MQIWHAQVEIPKYVPTQIQVEIQKQKPPHCAAKRATLLQRIKIKESFILSIFEHFLTMLQFGALQECYIFVMTSIIYMKLFIIVLFQCAFMNRLLAASAWPNLVTPRTAPPTSIMRSLLFAKYCRVLQNTAGYCKILQNTAGYFKILQNTANFAGWQDLAGFRRGQTWPWNLSSST